ncbi:MAG: hypothetical protein JW827_06335 [Spirochaetes bacterium]|nr:hypothetical protein [Spirochaetota bacterium]
MRSLLLLILLMILNSPVVRSESSSTSEKQDLSYQYYIKSIIECNNQNYTKACEYSKKFLEQHPSCNQINIMFKEAFDKFQKVEMALFQGQEMYNARHYEEALSFFHQVLGIEPANDRALDYIKKCYEKLRIKVKIVDEPTSEGKEIVDLEMSLDDEKELHAVGYDALGKFMGPVKVKWVGLGDLKKLNIFIKQSSIIFSPVATGSDGKLRAIAYPNGFDETGTIRVTEGRAASLKITRTENHKDDEVKELFPEAGREIRLYAHGYDQQGHYTGPVPVTWRVRGEPDKIFKSWISHFNFKSKKKGEGQLIVNMKNGFQKEIPVKITPLEASYIQIENAPDGKGSEIFSIKLLTGKKYDFYANAYDKYHNFVENPEVNWQTTSGLEPIFIKNRSHLEFTQYLSWVGGEIEASKEGLVGDKTGSIYVYPGEDTLDDAQKKALMEKIARENKVIYFVRTGDILARIVSTVLKLPYRWHLLAKYIYAIGEYNKMPDVNLIIYDQPIYFPFMIAEKNETIKDFADRVLGSPDRASLVVIYNSDLDIIKAGDRIIILDEDFLKTGDEEFIEAKYQ